MTSTTGRTPHGADRAPRGRPMSEVGVSPEEAQQLRARLASFARQWDDPRMDADDAAP